MRGTSMAHFPRAIRPTALSLLALVLACGSPPTPGDSPGDSDLRFEISLSPELGAEPLDGRVLLLISTTDNPEPRFQGLRSTNPPQIFGGDVEALGPGESTVLGHGSRGYPLESLAEIPAGDYFVQAVFNLYTTFRRADGHTIKAHMDQWEGQQWNRSPGNLVSSVEGVRIDPASDDVIRLTLDQRIPPLEPPEDTDYVKHIRFRSDILSEWWGHDMELGAVVVLPAGFEDHPEARYPVVYWHGHFPFTFNGFRETPPEEGLTGSALARAESQYRFFQDWVSGELGRFLLVFMQHPTPFYDDSYAVNSRTTGPTGTPSPRSSCPGWSPGSGPSASPGPGRCRGAPRVVGNPWPGRCSTRTSSTGPGPSARTRWISATSSW